MSSWLSSLSLPNSFQSSDSSPPPDSPTPSPPDHVPPSSFRVKDDLSVLSQTIGRQLRGFASFLAPPPLPHYSAADDDDDDDDSSSPSYSSSEAMVGIRKDLVEIGGSLKTSLFSLLSPNKAVSDISRFASSFLHSQNYEDEEPGDAVGVSEEVLDFARQISLLPELWTNFPLSLPNDFTLSAVQKEHAATVEYFVPNLVDLKHRICSDLSEEEFWMIYFILLLPRLNKSDLELLSTSKIVEARERLLHQLQNNRNTQMKSSENSAVNTSQDDGNVNTTQGDDSSSQEKKVLTETASAAKTINIVEYDSRGQWLEEDADVNAPTDVQKQPEIEEDISFSDLEDDDNDLSGRLSGLRLAQSSKISSPSEWVRLNKNTGVQGCRQTMEPSSYQEKDSEDEESNDWLTVDDIDLDSLAAV